MADPAGASAAAVDGAPDGTLGLKRPSSVDLDAIHVPEENETGYKIGEHKKEVRLGLRHRDSFAVHKSHMAGGHASGDPAKGRMNAILAAWSTKGEDGSGADAAGGSGEEGDGSAAPKKKNPLRSMAKGVGSFLGLRKSKKKRQEEEMAKAAAAGGGKALGSPDSSGVAGSPDGRPLSGRKSSLNAILVPDGSPPLTGRVSPASASAAAGGDDSDSESDSEDEEAVTVDASLDLRGPSSPALGGASPRTSGASGGAGSMPKLVLPEGIASPDGKAAGGVAASPLSPPQGTGPVATYSGGPKSPPPRPSRAMGGPPKAPPPMSPRASTTGAAGGAAAGSSPESAASTAASASSTTAAAASSTGAGATAGAPPPPPIPSPTGFSAAPPPPPPSTAAPRMSRASTGSEGGASVEEMGFAPTTTGGLADPISTTHRRADKSVRGILRTVSAYGPSGKVPKAEREAAMAAAAASEGASSTAPTEIIDRGRLKFADHHGGSLENVHWCEDLHYSANADHSESEWEEEGEQEKGNCTIM